MRRLRLALSMAALAVGFTACAGGSSADGSTSWLSLCTKSSECGAGLSCICGACTRPCDASRACEPLGGDAACGSALELGGRCLPGEEANVCVRVASPASAVGSGGASATPPGVRVDGGPGASQGHDFSADGGRCDGTCPRSCTTSAECQDGNFCNGVETCEAGPAGKTCKAGVPLTDGTSCGVQSVCSGAVCRTN